MSTAQRVGAQGIGDYRIALEEQAILEPALAKLVVGVDDLVLSTLFSRGAGAEQRKRNAGSKTQRAGRAWIDGAGSVHSLPLKYHEPSRVAGSQSRAVAARGPSVGFARAPRARAQLEHVWRESRNQHQLRS
jgi:hypothetical protein